MTEHSFGWLGWFSALGFVILGGLYVIDVFAEGLWPFSATWTLAVALLAGLGAIALYYGHDPTDRERRDTTV